MAGRLGVLRRLEGEEGALLLAGQLDDVRAESLRSSLSASICVRRSAEARGPGLVRGRRTLLSHPRAGGSSGGFAVVVVVVVVAGAHVAVAVAGVCCALGSAVVATRALPERSAAAAAASSLIATRGAASSHEVVLGDDGGPGEMKRRLLRLRRTAGRTNTLRCVGRQAQGDSMLTSRATGDRENIEMQQPCEDPGTLAWDLDMANDKGALSRLPPCQCSSCLARG
jgi:hypothetical protein